MLENTCKGVVIATMMLVVMAMAGCGTGLQPATKTTGIAAGTQTLTGHVHGGQQPVSGAVIQLYAVGITGLKSASTPLISATISTDQNGRFDITGDWNCTSNTAIYGVNPLLYIVASGGNPGMVSGTNNSAINLVGRAWALQQCGCFHLHLAE